MSHELSRPQATKPDANLQADREKPKIDPALFPVEIRNLLFDQSQTMQGTLEELNKGPSSITRVEKKIIIP